MAPAPLPLASRGPISHKSFARWLDEAAAVATGESAPVLIAFALDGLDDRRDDALIGAVAWQLCDIVGDEGLVCRLGSARLAVMLASDGGLAPERVCAALAAGLAQPVHMNAARCPGVRYGVARWGRQGTTATALFTAAAYALQEAQNAALASAVRIASRG